MPPVRMKGDGRKAKNPQPFAKGEILAVGIGTQIGTLQLQLALLVHQPLLGIHAHDIGKKQVVAALGTDLGHPAAKGKGALTDQGHGDLLYLYGGQMAFFPLVHLGARIHAAIIGGLDQGRGRQIQYEFPALLDQRVGMAARPHRDIGLGRHGVQNARPRHGQNIGGVSAAAADHYGRQGAQERRALPVDLCHNSIHLHITLVGE